MRVTRPSQSLLLLTVVDGLMAVSSPAVAAEANPGPTTTAVSSPPVAMQANPMAPTTTNASPSVATASSNQVAPTNTFGDSSPSKLSFVLNVPLTYEMPGGVNFDGHHGYTVRPGQVAHLPKLSGGIGVRPGVGVFVRDLAPMISGMALFNLDWSRHSAKSYNAGGVAYEHDVATTINTAIELRALLDIKPIKPFVALAPGYGWLKLPTGLTVVDPITSNTTWRDLTLRGFTFALSFGAMYPITDWLLVEGAVGCRFQSYTASNFGSLSGVGMSPSLNVGIGVTVRL